MFIVMALVAAGASVFLFVFALSLFCLLPLPAPIVDDVARIPALVSTSTCPTGLRATASGVAGSTSPSARGRVLLLLLDCSRRHQCLDPSRYWGCGVVFAEHGNECLHKRRSDCEILLGCSKDALAFWVRLQEIVVNLATPSLELSVAFNLTASFFLQALVLCFVVLLALVLRLSEGADHEDLPRGRATSRAAFRV